jgi:hypothetical protein
MVQNVIHQVINEDYSFVRICIGVKLFSKRATVVLPLTAHSAARNERVSIAHAEKMCDGFRSWHELVERPSRNANPLLTRSRLKEWSFICHRQSFSDIAASFNVCERTVRWYVDLFQRTGDVILCQRRRHGPLPLLGEF